jgi:hypothetical protein
MSSVQKEAKVGVSRSPRRYPEFVCRFCKQMLTYKNVKSPNAGWKTITVTLDGKVHNRCVVGLRVYTKDEVRQMNIDRGYLAEDALK